MDDRHLADLTSLSAHQKALLARAKLKTVSDLLPRKPKEMATKCRMKLKELNELIDLVCQELYQPPKLLRDVAHVGWERFTTGDSVLDDVLGGGVRTGMVWEISGEKNAGKTQLALQLALTAQLPPQLGGVSGATFYIHVTPSLEPQKVRLEEIIAHHPLLSPTYCDSSNIQSEQASSFEELDLLLRDTIPTSITHREAQVVEQKSFKLIIIDTFSDLFDPKTHAVYEKESSLRTRQLRRASSLLHKLAMERRVAVVILGATRATRPRTDGEDKSAGELRFSDQARWFSRAYSLPPEWSEDANEAILGHVWPNQLNARIMMSRTTRTRTRAEVDEKMGKREEGRAVKRRKLDSGKAQGSGSQPGEETVPFRRFSVIFSSAALPRACDFVILDQGVVAFPDEDAIPSTFRYATPTPPPVSASPSTMASTSSRAGPSVPSVPPSTPSSWSNSGIITPRSRQSLSYVTVPSSPRSTHPPASSPTVGPGPANDDGQEEMWWELTQEQASLFDTLPDSALQVPEGVVEDGPPDSEDGSSDSETVYWRHFDEF